MPLKGGRKMNFAVIVGGATMLLGLLVILAGSSKKHSRAGLCLFLIGNAAAVLGSFEVLLR
jgi:hypothetical protein